MTSRSVVAAPGGGGGSAIMAALPHPPVDLAMPNVSMLQHPALVGAVRFIFRG
jgi:hypothetical protein